MILFLLILAATYRISAIYSFPNFSLKIIHLSLTLPILATTCGRFSLNLYELIKLSSSSTSPRKGISIDPMDPCVNECKVLMAKYPSRYQLIFIRAWDRQYISISGVELIYLFMFFNIFTFQYSIAPKYILLFYHIGEQLQQ